MKILYRHARTDGDMNFAVESMLSSYRHSTTAGPIPFDLWFDTMRPVIKALMARPKMQTWVAQWVGAKAGIADLAGFVSLERGYLVQRKAQRFMQTATRLVVCPDPIILYVYVKRPYRMDGIARGLMAAAGVDLTRTVRYAVETYVVDCLKEKIPKLKRDARALRFPPQETDVEESR